MFDKDLFDRICNVSCTWEDLLNFITNIDEKEFDLDEPFSKYFSADTVISAIEKYEANKIDAKFLNYWMTAYNWIIMGGFKIEYEDDSISLKELLMWDISDWIDSLSFFEAEDSDVLETHKNAFKVLSFLLDDVENCKAVFAHKEIKKYYDEPIVALVINDKAKYFLKEYSGFCSDDDENFLFPQVTMDALDNMATQLKNQGYKELNY